MALLHKSHSRISKMYATTRARFYWPHMKNDITNIINKCEQCQMHCASLPTDEYINSSASCPMEKVATDLFIYKNVHYLIMVDCFSRYTWLHPLKRLSSEAIISQFKKWFLHYGFPRTIRSYGGPQFRSTFKAFCDDFGIIHKASSPYNPRSNGLAEINI